MKNSILTMTAIALIASAVVTGCNTSAKKVENAEDNVAAAEQDLTKANQEYLADLQKYREEVAMKIATNNKSIAEFNARMDNQKAEAKADYKKRIDAIQQKNSDMKKKLDEFKAESKEQWENFKAEFSRDMEDLGIAFKNMTTSSNK